MRHAIHLVASILMWVLFSWYWYLVMQRQVSPSSLRSVGLLFVISAVGLVVTIGWVAHNKRIAARNRRRGGRPAVSEILPTDHLGRPMTGVAAADPRVVPDAPFLPRLDYRSMYRLASNGARVLHDRSALLGERFGVRIRVRSTFDEGDGTLVSADTMPAGSPAVLGIASNKAASGAVVTVVCMEGRGTAIAGLAAAAAAKSGAVQVPSTDADALAYSCTAEQAPDLVRTLFATVGRLQA